MDHKENHTVFSPHGETIRSSVPVHPGEILKDEIIARDIGKEDFAQKLDIAVDVLSEIFSGKRNINLEIACKIEQVLDIKADFWLRMQKRYELTVEEKNSGKTLPFKRLNMYK